MLSTDRHADAARRGVANCPPDRGMSTMTVPNLGRRQLAALGPAILGARPALAQDRDARSLGEAANAICLQMLAGLAAQPAPARVV